MSGMKPTMVGAAVNDKGVRGAERKLAGFPGPTASYGASLGPTGNKGSPGAACKLLASQDQRSSRAKGGK